MSVSLQCFICCIIFRDDIEVEGDKLRARKRAADSEVWYLLDVGSNFGSITFLLVGVTVFPAAKLLSTINFCFS